jgi:hypothetical protein
MPDKKSLQTLVAAGRRLKVDPETFDITMGPLRGVVVNMSVKETKGSATQIIDGSGKVVNVDGAPVYCTTLEIQWKPGTNPSQVREMKDSLTSLGRKIAERNRLLIKEEHGEDAEFYHYTSVRE